MMTEGIGGLVHWKEEEHEKREEIAHRKGKKPS